MFAGEVISCLENAEAVQSVDLNELSVTLDIFVLTLPLEIEAMADFHHNRSCAKSSFFNLNFTSWSIAVKILCRSVGRILMKSHFLKAVTRSRNKDRNWWRCLFCSEFLKWPLKSYWCLFGQDVTHFPGFDHKKQTEWKESWTWTKNRPFQRTKDLSALLSELKWLQHRWTRNTFERETRQTGPQFVSVYVTQS